jgi:hypothetical protein
MTLIAAAIARQGDHGGRRAVNDLALPQAQNAQYRPTKSLADFRS